ncbi:hypothetical protein REPUB_Repub18cG0058200 [Reevesia pubescens]
MMVSGRLFKKKSKNRVGSSSASPRPWVLKIPILDLGEACFGAGSNPSKGLQDGYGKDNVNTKVEKDNDVEDVSNDDVVVVDDSDNELLADDLIQI